MSCNTPLSCDSQSVQVVNPVIAIRVRRPNAGPTNLQHTNLHNHLIAPCWCIVYTPHSAPYSPYSQPPPHGVNDVSHLHMVNPRTFHMVYRKIPSSYVEHLGHRCLALCRQHKCLALCRQHNCSSAQVEQGQCIRFMDAAGMHIHTVHGSHAAAQGSSSC